MSVLVVVASIATAAAAMEAAHSGESAEQHEARRRRSQLMPKSLQYLRSLSLTGRRRCMVDKRGALRVAPSSSSSSSWSFVVVVVEVQANELRANMERQATTERKWAVSAQKRERQTSGRPVSSV